ncbi:hypothetical protein C8Q80DRAFT_1272511 [Daedaleopsis nitida]|nr:hypothetical protein C8Q80DRAFT_1272511 [Daedaleopsis nitida]
MSDIEFVIEAPHVSRANKKRPRLVTSCDHCRVKKIKCVQHPSSGKCEACLSANLPCLYRDREQYFAERTRMLSGGNSALRDASTNAQSRAHLSAINASTPSPSPTPSQSSRASCSHSSTPDRSNSPSSSYFGVAALSPPNGSGYSHSWDSGYNLSTGLPTWDAPPQPLSWGPRHSPDMHSQPHTGLTLPATASTQPFTPLPGLFDLSNPAQPHPTLMMNFLQVFFDRLGPTYTFLSSQSICERYLHHRLPPLLANAIAASAAHFSTLPDIVQIGPANAADVYCQMAKTLVPTDSSPATVDTLHATMLLAWVEYKRNHHTMFSAYARMVPRLASELGISEESLPHLTRVSDPRGAQLLQATWQGIQMLERTLLAAELVALANPSPQPQPPSQQHQPHPQLQHPHSHSHHQHHHSYSSQAPNVPSLDRPSLW